MNIPSSLRRRLTWAAAGFGIGAALAYALFLVDAMFIEHFQELYGMPRPRSVAEWLEFQEGYASVFVAAGAAGALLGCVASFARKRGQTAMQAT
jgi:hypothetical protein